MPATATDYQLETSSRYDAFRQDALEKSLVSILASVECYEFGGKFISCRVGNNQVVITPGIISLGSDAVFQIIKKVINFKDFNERNDPWNEHDMGFFDHSSGKIMWKIEDYQGYQKTELVLTIMMGEEY